MIRVLFDDVFFAMGSSGVARYWESVLKIWNESTILQDHEIEFMVLNRSGVLEDLGFRLVDFGRHRRKGADFRAAERAVISAMCEDLKIDVFISSYYTWVLGPKNLLPVYDLIPEMFDFPSTDRDWIERKFAPVAADSFIAISESTRRDLITCHPHIKPEDVSLARPGIDHDVFSRPSDDHIEAFLRGQSISEPYLLIPGTRYGGATEYKNSRIVFETLAANAHLGLDVIVTGGELLSDGEVSALARAGRRIMRLELTDAELSCAYAAAKVVVYPSLYEGFGMAPLEALAVGTPVVTTNTSSLPEAVGDLSLFFDGVSSKDLMDQIELSLTPAHVGRIRKDGPSWAKNFIWTSTAEAIARAIRNCHDAPQIAHREAMVSALREYNKKSIELQS